jgi:uncharacterized protein YjbI with pentapeptide repeats
MSNEQAERPTTDDRDAWSTYWVAQGISWRTEPEIDEERQHYLAERRALQPDIERGIYPFKDIQLTRADVEWLLATHEDGRGPLKWDEEREKPFPPTHWGLDLRGADLRGASLTYLPLVRLRGGSVPAPTEESADPQQEQEQGEAAAAHFEGADLNFAHLEGAWLCWAHLEGSLLGFSHLDHALLIHAHLEEADLASATMNGTVLADAHLEGALVVGTDLRGAAVGVTSARLGERSWVFRPGAHLAGADLGTVSMDATTNLFEVSFSDEQHGGAFLGDVSWGGVNLGVVDWTPVTMLGEEQVARMPAARRQAQRFLNPERRLVTRQEWYVWAVRGYRQLATLLRLQGVNEVADHFAYRAQVLQRQVLRRQGHWLRSFGSLFLDVVSGYGYRPLRSVLTYLLVVAGFALAYFALGGAGGHPLTWNESLVVSLTAFHGRGFFATAFQPGDPQAALAAIEAVIGLLIEIIFIATFTQRFFAR